MKRVAIIVSPNHGDHARRYLHDCLESLRAQDWPGEMKIFITDNQSTEESFSSLRAMAPEAEIVRNATNDGFAKGNNDAIRAALQAGYDLVVLFNMDTIVEADCISRLVETAESDRGIGAVQARIMLWPERDRINSLGNTIHFLGFGYCEGYREGLAGLDLHSVRNIGCPSGSAVLYKREVLEETGLLDETFWMYNEDHDLGWRIWLAGWRCVLSPQAVVHHKYEFSGDSRKYYLLDRNRLVAMIKNYRFSTLLLILPAFVIMEFGVVLFAIERGWFKEKLAVYRYFLRPKNWKTILEARRKSQTVRRVRERDVVGRFSGRIWYDEVGDWKLKLVNSLLGPYWNVTKWLLRLN